MDLENSLQNTFMNIGTFFIIYDLIVSFIAGVIIGRDARRRGMSGAGWGLFTMVALIIALPLYAIVKRPEE